MQISSYNYEYNYQIIQLLLQLSNVICSKTKMFETNKAPINLI